MNTMNEYNELQLEQIRRETEQGSKTAAKALANIKLLGDTNPTLYRNLLTNLCKAEAKLIAETIVEGQNKDYVQLITCLKAEEHELVGLFVDQVNQLVIDPKNNNFQMKKNTFYTNLVKDIETQVQFNRISYVMDFQHLLDKEDYKELSKEERKETPKPRNMNTWLEKTLAKESFTLDKDGKLDRSPISVTAHRIRNLKARQEWFEGLDNKAATKYSHLSALGTDAPRLDLAGQIKLGKKLHDAFMPVLEDVVEMYEEYQDGVTTHWIRLKEDTRDTVLEALDARSRQHTSNQHMVCEPNKLEEGKLDITYRYMTQVQRAKNEKVYPGISALAALNAMQAVPFRANLEVLDVIYGLNYKHTFQILGYQAAYKNELSSQQKTKLKAFEQALAGAEDAGQYDRFYFPAFYDTRSRSYYGSTDGFSPQGHKHVRGVLEFADAVALGKTGLKALYIELANTMGHDKETLRTRVRLAKKVDVAAIASAPKANLEWLDYDEPVKALAVIMDIAAALASGNPESHMSHIICHVDGSCNGLQHLSLFGFDQKGAMATNVIPTIVDGEAVRRDIYADAGDLVLEYLKEHKEDQAELIRICTKGQTYTHVGEKDKEGNPLRTPMVSVGIRTMVKPGTMCTSYGVSQSTIREDLIYSKQVATKEQATLFAKALVNALTKLLPEAMLVRKWLVSAVRTMTRKGISPSWTLPNETMVEQVYLDYPMMRIRLLGGKETDLPNPDAPRKDTTVKINENCRAIVANLVHSCDAAAMHLTVNGLLAEGITNMSFVHDSFGCAAGNMDALNRILRQAHIDLYSPVEGKTFLDGIAQGFNEQLLERGPVLPEHIIAPFAPSSEAQGFDLQDILKSDYFFA